VNPQAFEHEYLGIPVNDGSLVFTNLEIRSITNEEIEQFDNVRHGLDWGFYPDPASYGKMYYDSTRRKLYIFGEYRAWKKSNEDLHQALIDSKLYSDNELIVADSAEPKSVGDFKAYGASCRGAEKGPGTRNYSYKWLQGLNSIIIDNIRAPYHAEEFLNCEYERTKDGEIITEYPEKNDHAIDDTRYGTNPIWRRRGE
jgi:phage terminase large subunit